MSEPIDIIIPIHFCPDHNQLRGVSEDNHHPPFTVGDHHQVDHNDIPGVPNLELIKKLDIDKIAKENKNYSDTLYVYDEIQKGKILLKKIQDNYITQAGLKFTNRISLKKWKKTKSETTAIFNFNEWEGFYDLKKIDNRWVAKKFKRNAGQVTAEYYSYDFYITVNPNYDSKNFLFWKNTIDNMAIYFYSEGHPTFLNNLIQYDLNLYYCPGSYARLATPIDKYVTENWVGDEKPTEIIHRPMPKIFTSTIGEPGLYDKVPPFIVINGKVKDVFYVEGEKKVIQFIYEPGIISYSKLFMLKEAQFKMEYR